LVKNKMYFSPSLKSPFLSRKPLQVSSWPVAKIAEVLPLKYVTRLSRILASFLIFRLSF
jgi:hypothetical protein